MRYDISDIRRLCPVVALGNRAILPRYERTVGDFDELPTTSSMKKAEEEFVQLHALSMVGDLFYDSRIFNMYKNEHRPPHLVLNRERSSRYLVDY